MKEDRRLVHLNNLQESCKNNKVVCVGIISVNTGTQDASISKKIINEIKKDALKLGLIKANTDIGKNITINGVSRNITYEGKRIKTYGNNEYFYNEEGVRIKKVTETNKTHEYIVEGSKILYEKIYTTGTTTTLAELYYNYNQYGELVSVEYNNKLYFYIKDILGNIVKIIDETEVTKSTKCEIENGVCDNKNEHKKHKHKRTENR